MASISITDLYPNYDSGVEQTVTKVAGGDNPTATRSNQVAYHVHGLPPVVWALIGLGGVLVAVRLLHQK